MMRPKLLYDYRVHGEVEGGGAETARAGGRPPVIGCPQRGEPHTDKPRGGVMAGQPVHVEIPADDTAKGREFWVRSSGGSSSRSPDRSSTTWLGSPIRPEPRSPTWSPASRGSARTSTDDINAGAARVRELGGEAGEPASVPNMGGASPTEARTRIHSSRRSRRRRPRRRRPGMGRCRTSSRPDGSTAPIQSPHPRHRTCCRMT